MTSRFCGHSKRSEISSHRPVCSSHVSPGRTYDFGHHANDQVHGALPDPYVLDVTGRYEQVEQMSSQDWIR